MTDEAEGPYRVGQRVEVKFTAHVGSVTAGSSETAEAFPLVRLDLIGSDEPRSVWLNPEVQGVDITVLSDPLPSEPGMYRRHVGAAENSQDSEWTADGYEFYYLNAAGNWCDIGWGQPLGLTGKEALERMEPLPF